MSRLISDLSPEMQPFCNQWCVKMDTAGIKYIITCTKRTDDEQMELWKQGRELRNAVWFIVDNKKVVTWTLDSRHLTGDAFDFVIIFAGKPDWKMVQKDMWTKAVEFGKELGLSQVIGKNGKVKEYAHLQRS